MSRHVALLFAVLATAAEVAAGYLLVTGEFAGAGGLHVAATLLSVWAARRRRPDLSRVEEDLVWVTALLVPLFGPALAWAMPRPVADEDVENAHEIFERYSDHVKPCSSGSWVGRIGRGRWMPVFGYGRPNGLGLIRGNRHDRSSYRAIAMDPGCAREAGENPLLCTANGQK